MSCAGGWWYKYCRQVNLNGKWSQTKTVKGIIWKGWKGDDYSYKKAQMKIGRN